MATLCQKMQNHFYQKILLVCAITFNPLVRLSSFLKRIKIRARADCVSRIRYLKSDY